MSQAPGTTVILSGASGVVGSALRHALAARGTPMRRLLRGAPQQADEVTWNPEATTPFASTEALEGARAAIHLSGANIAGARWTSTYKHELAASRVDSTHALATTLARLEHRPEVLVVASAVGFYGNRGGEVLDEFSPPGKGFLPELCQLWEEAAHPAAERGIRVVHTRFSVLLNRGPGALAKLLPVFRAGLGGPLGSGHQWMSWVGVEDAIAAILFALETPQLAGPVNVTSPNPVRNAEFTRTLARLLHRPAVIPMPAFVLRAAFGQMADEALLASARVMPTKLAQAGFRFQHPTLEEALAAALR
ncbi:MAG: TIGR01777 family oxidoreductase [Terracidiphilus sp.]